MLVAWTRMVVKVMKIYFYKYVFQVEPTATYLLLYWMERVRKKEEITMTPEFLT